MEALLISVVIAIVVFCVLWWLTGMIPEATIQKIARIVLVVIAAIWLIKHIGPLVRALT